jgi:hypothetical protein
VHVYTGIPAYDGDEHTTLWAIPSEYVRSASSFPRSREFFGNTEISLTNIVSHLISTRGLKMTQDELLLARAKLNRRTGSETEVQQRCNRGATAELRRGRALLLPHAPY